MVDLRFFQTKPIYCFGIDDNYVWPLLVSLYSAKKNFHKFKNVNILYDPKYLHENSISTIKNVCNLLRVNPTFVALQVPKTALRQNHISSTSYLRLLAPEIFRKNVFWLDADLLFLNNWQKVLKYAIDIKANKEMLFARLHWGNPKSSSNQAIIKS